ncbi:Protein Jade-1 like [Actinidia chinensis var. chinensis]|uniref:Protein Jade-1 like n=1 Tax=Actinidia chinensis var. chinensis TaxID=1590841 RepID=A0A2R6Q1W9_ACTCC|nr:Protein Jade-1 like [Actinidia chinensis var. chinensis]
MQGWCWWRWLVAAMTGGQCHRRRKMMGRGPGGGCGTEEQPCPISRVPAKFPVKESATLEKPKPIGIDLYTQAWKALCERSPFDAEDTQVSTIPTLPSGLANCLLRHSNGRKRRKRAQSGTEAKSSRSEKTRRSNIWAETEDCFRELTVEDIDKLHELSISVFSSSQKCLSIPVLGNVVLDSVDSGGIANEINGVNANGFGSDCGVGVKEEVKEEEKQLMEIDSVGVNVLVEEEKGCSSSSQVATEKGAKLCSGVEWLLGSRSKIHLTSERPSKKRKLLGGDAGLEKLLVACPVDGLSSLCHYCSLGDTGDQLNRLIVCSSCNVAVHQRCYGVQDDVAGPWLCSWCKNGNAVQSSERPCLLCPRQGGALKPVSKRGVGSENGSSMEFAHLFCCQWMPEVYIQDMRTLEPISNVEEIKETRRKLICCICKVKYGACIRCSNGTCRTSFHPICAREAKHRMEIWGKFGCDEVELWAFCSKHSGVQNGSSTQQSGDVSVTIGSDSFVTKHQLERPIVNKPHKLKIGRKNGDRTAVRIETTDTNINKLGNSVLHEGLSDTRSNARRRSGCGDTQQPASTGTLNRSTNDDANTSDSLDFTLILKKLIERGKVDVKDVASEIGIPPDSLASMLADNCLVPDLRSKIVTWVRNHAYISTSKTNLKVRIKSSIASKDDMGAAEDSDAVMASESVIPDVVPVKSVPPRRRTKSSIRILKDNKVICSSKETISDDGVVTDEAKRGQLFSEDANYSSKGSVSDVIWKNLEPGGIHVTLAKNSPKCVGDSLKNINAAISEQNMMPNLDPENTTCSVIKNDIPDPIKADAVFSSYIHPLVRNKMVKLQNAVLLENATCDCDGSRDQEISPSEPSSNSGICCNQRVEHLTPSDVISKFDGPKLELVKARNMDVLEMSPEDEVEEEIIFHQHKLLCNVITKKCISDDLIHKVVKSLPQEIDDIGKRKWDAVLVNQYLSELREAKKQGRKERRHKEAQAVLAAATAAAAASLRNSSFRKDALDESAHQETLSKLNPLAGRAGLNSQQMPRAKETLSKLASPRVSSEMKSDFGQSISDLCKEHPRTCDICGRSETILNPILVGVHLDCYRSVKDSTGPWYCELCEEFLSCRSSVAVNSWEKPYFAAECGLCGGNAGAFRKSTDGQWIHAFCAEWVLESTFRRGQVNPVEGVASVLKGSDVCHVCHRKQGVCIKCNYGHCQSMFHPSCARGVGFYMNTKTVGGKLQHKAYCLKHSLEQRAKAETQGHGVEELKSLKQIRVELERLRLLCERIIRREKLKRELVLCSQDILVSNRDSAALSALVRSPFFPPDVSSESATTSLRNTDDCRSGSEAIQRSDDVTVDSTVSGKRCIKFPMSMDNDQKTDDSSTSQYLFIQKPKERISFAGKQIPQRSSFVASQSLSDDGEKRSKCKKHTETFEKELVMTSDQASVKNQRLPKGFVYVPVRYLSKEKNSVPDAYSGKPLERDG